MPILQSGSSETPRPATVAATIASAFFAKKFPDTRTFRLDAIADAHRYMESNDQKGKIVVTV
ncbi:MAG: hypothetical protein E2O65_00935 [Gammaproteobacteria bacterium]|nr:MAG: hypothetical protein E2O65_00935 [Gammaproteobacteria bacterium]